MKYEIVAMLTSAPYAPRTVVPACPRIATTTLASPYTPIATHGVRYR
jgi:hypothetical protein